MLKLQHTLETYEQDSPLARFVLRRTIGFADRRIAQFQMLGFPATNALAPHSEAAGLHMAAHQCDHVIFIDTELLFNGFKWRSIFPRHLDNPGYLFF